MIVCPNCGQSVIDGQEFCSACGCFIGSVATPAESDDMPIKSDHYIADPSSPFSQYWKQRAGAHALVFIILGVGMIFMAISYDDSNSRPLAAIGTIMLIAGGVMLASYLRK